MSVPHLACCVHLQIDVEGFEPSVLHGTRDLLLKVGARPTAWSPLAPARLHVYAGGGAQPSSVLPCPAPQPDEPAPRPLARFLQHTVEHVFMEYSPGVAERSADFAWFESNPTSLMG